MTAAQPPRGGTLQIRFRAGPMEPAILARCRDEDEANELVRRDQDRYYALLARELRGVALTEGEAGLLCDIGNGTLWEPASIPLLWAEVADALAASPELAAKWGVGGDSLVERLRRLTVGQCYAVADAVERYWRLPHADDLLAQLRAVGLVR